MTVARQVGHRAFRSSAGFAGLVSIALPGGPAFGADWGGAVTATSDYVHRGVSQSDGAVAVQADVHVRSEGGWFAGVWTSSADPPPGNVASYEIDVYAGRSWAIRGGWTASIGYQRYMYPNSLVHRQYDFDEVRASVGFEDRLALTASYSPNSIRYSRYGWSARAREVAYELSVRQPALGPIAIVAGAGYYDTSALFNETYWAWSAGLSANAGPLQFTLARFGTDATARKLFGSFAADHWVLTATAHF